MTSANSYSGDQPRTRMCVLGLGYIGLPTASMFAVSGVEVLGVDPSPRVHDALRSGRLHIEEPDLEALVSAALNSGRLKVAMSPEPADVFVLAVPTPFASETHHADLSFVCQAAEGLLPHLRPGNLVILESTVPPGTTRDVLAPLLAQSGLLPGRDIHLAHCPERVLPGRILLELVENDRLAGGLTPQCADAAARLYGLFVRGAVLRTDATTAEMVKVMENTFRDVNIALANELARIAEHVGVNVWQAIDLANRHPRVNVLRPGPGVGGHCIAVDPWFLVAAAPDAARLIRTAREVNDAMPGYVVEHIQAAVPPGGSVALVGLTYKADIDDVRESPSLRVAELAVERGFKVRLCDPHVKPEGQSLPAPLLPLDEALANADALVLLVDHAVLRNLDPGAAAALMRRLVVIDTRAVLPRATWQDRGFKVIVLGASTTAEP